MIQPQPHIDQMAAYALARMAAPPGQPLISLSQNESIRPPSPKAIKAAKSVLKRGALYPDPDWTDLRQTLGQLHDIDENLILCGAGSLDLIGCLAQIYTGPDAAVLAPAHAYPFFRTAAQLAGARYDTAVEQGHRVSVDNLLQAVRADTRLIFVANPGNPTGTRIPKADLIRLRSGLPDNVLLVIDEAYGEFADPQGERCWDMIDQGNTVVLRTFSKAYGLAGLRVGWGLFPATVAAQMRKVMNPNGLTAPSQAAALAAARDHGYMVETCTLTADLHDLAISALTDAGLDAVPSLTNFLLIPTASAKTAGAAEQAMARRGIFLRRQQGAGLPHALRMTLAPEEHMMPAISALAASAREAFT